MLTRGHQIIREKGESVESFLCKLWCDFKADIRMCHNYEGKEGETGFTRRLSYFQLQHFSQDEMLSKHGISETRKEFTERAQHRTTMPAEIMIDIDDATLSNSLRFSSISHKAMWAYHRLKKIGYSPVMSFTGHKSYHISVIEPELAFMSTEQRKKWKEAFIGRFGGDMQLKGENALISLEGSKHYKSGKIKKAVMC